jgi:hypothetical protein
MDYLLTWNCRHIANAEIARRLMRECERMFDPVVEEVRCTREAHAASFD